MPRQRQTRALVSGALSGLLALAMASPLVLPAPAFAQPALEADTSFIHEMTLDNGLTVVVIEDHNVPIVTIEMAVRNGAFTEEPAFNGLSHLYEHMFFKSNAVYESQEAFMARQRELGMDWNGTTGSERVNYFFTLPAELLDEGLEFMAAALLTPRFQAEELAREREVVLGEYDRNEANPFYYLYDTMAKQLWHTYPSRKDSLGDRAAIAAATVEQMQWMKEAYYVPNNSLLVLSGDITREEGRALAEKHFATWTRSEDPHAVYPVPEHPPLTENVAAIVTQPVGISVIQMAWHGPDTRTSVQDTYTADVFSYVISQETSRLQQDLVESGLALSADVGYHTQRYVGPIYFTVVAQPGREAEVIAAMNDALSHFGDADYMSDEQLETAKTVLAVQDLSGQQSSLGLAHTVSFWWCSADLDYYRNYIENLRAVSREDIQQWVKTWMNGARPRATVLMGSPDTTAGWTPARLIQQVEATTATTTAAPTR